MRKGFAHPERLTRQEVEAYGAPLSRRQNRRATWMLQRNLHYSLTDRRLGEVRAPTLVLWGDRERFDEPWQAGELGRRIPGRPCGPCPAAGTWSTRTALPRPSHRWRASPPADPNLRRES